MAKIPDWAYLIPNGAVFTCYEGARRMERKYRLYWNKQSPQKWNVDYEDGTLCLNDYEMCHLHGAMRNGSLLNGEPIEYWEVLGQCVQAPEEEDINFEIPIL